MLRKPTFLSLMLVLLPIVAGAADWSQWQGPNRNAISPETGLLQEWPTGGPPLAWRIDGLGGGDSAPAVVDGKLFGMSNRDGKEVVWALSEADGKEIWVASLGGAVEQRMPQSQEGPGGTPTVDGDRLYVIGMGGKLVCLREKDGEILWEKRLVEDFGGVVPRWSFRESALVDGDKVICTPGASDAMLVALNKRTGETIWKTKMPGSGEQSTGGGSSPVEKPSRSTSNRAEQTEQPDSANRGGSFGGRRRRGFGGGRGGFTRSGAAYSSVIAIDFDGERQYVQLTANSLIGVDATDGKLLWQYDAPASSVGINCSTPIYQDGLLFAASADGTGGGAAKLVKGSNGKINAEEVYFSRSMQNHHGGMIVVDGALYGANGGNEGGFLTCMEFQTGKILWRDRNAPKGSLLLADGRLYLRAEDGEMILIEPSRDELKIRGRFEQPDRSNSPAWAHPIIANGKLYIRDQGLLLCYDLKSSES